MNHTVDSPSPPAPPHETVHPLQAVTAGDADQTWLRNALPTLLVLAGLAAIAIWGHSTGWTMPKFSALAGTGGASSDDWCEAHGVPESVCIACKPELFAKPVNYGWCAAHGVHNCPFEHPDVAQVTPRLDATFLRMVARAEQALKLTDRLVNGQGCKLHESPVQIASKEAFEKLGIVVETRVWRQDVTEAITAQGAELIYDQTRIARLSSRAAGTIWRVDKHVGDDVGEGEILAIIDSAEVGRARTAYLQAIAKVELKTRTLENLRSAEAVVTGRRISETEAELREARADLLHAQQLLANLGLPLSRDDLAERDPEKIAQRVGVLGLPEKARKMLQTETATGNLLPVTAPLAGKLVAEQKRQFVAGEVIDTDDVLFTVVDTGAMWLMLDIRVEDARLVQIGQKVGFRPDSHKQEIFGKVTWIDTAADDKTRTVKVRAEFANPPEDSPNIRLQGNMWGAGRIILREEKKNALLLPNEAIHHEGCCWVVFVQDRDFYKPDKPKVFHVRKVRLGARLNGNTEIIAGLLEDEWVASKNSGILRSALLRNNLGAG